MSEGAESSGQTGKAEWSEGAGEGGRCRAYNDGVAGWTSLRR